MFSASNTKTPFGGGGFSSTSSAFGTQTPFGQTSQGSLFGSNSQGTTFGTPSFGATQASSFGTGTSTGSSLFGGSNVGGGLFGQQQQQQQQGRGFNVSFGQGGTTGGLFGAVSQTPSTGLFQTPQQSGSLFGQQKTGFGTFGTQSSGGLFGGSTTSNPFGQTATSSSGLFGGMTFGSGTTGTVMKFVPVQSNEQMQKNNTTVTVQTKHQCITVMKEYEQKSLEELRLEDYAANRKSGTALATGTSTGTSLFGAKSTSGSLFGTSGSTFGQASTSGFGGFGQQSGGIFGQQQQTQQQSGGLFGNKPTGTGSIFGTPSTSSTGFGTSGGLFGQTGTSSTGGLFGTQSQSTSGGLFGGTSVFGQTQTTSSGGLFGGNVFGQSGQQQQTGGLFGSKPLIFGQASTNAGTLGTSTISFGPTSGASTGLFGNPTTTKSLFPFNTSGTTTFGGGNTIGGGTNLFGSATGTTGSLFGAPKPGFGQTAGTGIGTAFGTSAFGTNPAIGSGFGTTTGLGGTLGGLGAQNLGLGTSALAGVSANSLALLQQQQVMQQQLKALTSSPFGDSPLFRNLPGTKTEKTNLITTSMPSKSTSATSHYKVFSKPALRMKPKPITTPSLSKSKLFEGLDDEVEVNPSSLVPRKNIKKLVIKNKSDVISDDSCNVQLQLRSLIEDDSDDLLSPTPEVAVSPPKGKGREENLQDTLNTTGPETEASLDNTVSLLNARNKRTTTSDAAGEDVEQDVEENVCQIVLTRPEYYTEPPMNQLNANCQDGSCIVEDFVVGRKEYGEVKFLGETNVFGLNLDQIVFFRRREVEVYPDGYKNKPEVGTELNKKSEISLHKLWPNDKNTHTPIKNPDRLKKSGFLDRLEEKTAEMGAVFIDYRPETGTWVFQVEHFTRYGLHEQLFADEDGDKKRIDIQKEKAAMLAKLEETKAGKMQLLGKEDIIIHRESPQEENIQDDATDKSIGDQDITDVSSQMEDEEDIVDPGQLPPAESAGFTPFSFTQARVLGVKPERVQGMKAYLFDGEEDGTLYISPKEKKLFSGTLLSTGVTQPRTTYSMLDSTDMFDEEPKEKNSYLGSQGVADSPKKMPKLSHLFKSSFISQAKGDKDELGSSHIEASPLPQKVEKSKIITAVRRPGLCPYKKSLTTGKQAFIADVGLANGRCSRVGWTHGQKFIHFGEAISAMKSPQETGSVDTGVKPSIFGHSMANVSNVVPSDFTLKVERVRSRLSVNGGDRITLDYLKNALQYSDITQSPESLPVIQPQPGCEALHNYKTIADSYKQSIASSPEIQSVNNQCVVWGLATALWGKLDSLNIGIESVSKHAAAYEERIQRREAVSKWFSNTLEEEIKREVEESKFKDNGHLDAILSLLSGRQIAAACKMATRNREFRLALLISQASGDDNLRSLIRKQVGEWGELKADKFFDPRRLQIYLLLSGMMVFQSSQGLVNLCKDLDWKRTLALHLWYLCPTNAGISDALEEYRNAFKGTENYDAYAARPNPPYTTEESGSEAKDLCYHLLKLYCKRSHRLEKLLATDTYSDEAVDHQLSWHLHQCLISLGYSQFSETCHDYIQTSYAAQLETQGLWEWAVFVLLHIKDDIRRKAAVSDIISRFCNLDKSMETGTLNEKEQFLTESLQIPARLIHEAKALSAKRESRYHDEAIHLLQAGRWNDAHMVTVNEIATSAIIDEEYEYIRNLLLQLAEPERCCLVKNWATGGQIYLDYVMVREKLNAIEKEEISVTSYLLEDLESDISSLITRIGNMTCNSPKERLCQSDMARSCSNLLKIVLAEMKSQDGVTDDDICTWPTSKVASHVTRLPLTPECNLRELRELIAHYSQDIEQ